MGQAKRSIMAKEEMRQGHETCLQYYIAKICRDAWIKLCTHSDHRCRAYTPAVGRQHNQPDCMIASRKMPTPKKGGLTKTLRRAILLGASSQYSHDLRVRPSPACQGRATFIFQNCRSRRTQRAASEYPPSAYPNHCLQVDPCRSNLSDHFRRSQYVLAQISGGFSAGFSRNFRSCLAEIARNRGGVAEKGVRRYEDGATSRCGRSR